MFPVKKKHGGQSIDTDAHDLHDVFDFMTRRGSPYKVVPPTIPSESDKDMLKFTYTYQSDAGVVSVEPVPPKTNRDVWDAWLFWKLSH